jgi:3D (Asp-Asp-Asp) domain-containing protein
MRLLPISIVLTFFCAANVDAADNFDLPPPGNLQILASKTLWATEYHVHSAVASHAVNAVPLKNDKGAELGVSLAHNDWCNAAMEGTVIVQDDKKIEAFNAGSLGPSDQADCSNIFKHVSAATLANIKRQSFFILGDDDKFGLGGIDKYRLVPFRSIAVDRSRIPWGTAFYIPNLRGALITLPDSRIMKHDGYVYAVDKGGEIKGNHIDFFIGLPPTKTSPPIPSNFVSSNPNKTFTAYYVEDSSVTNTLRALHVRY